MFDCGPVYYANYQSSADVVVNQGGTDSSKTYSILQVFATIATTTKAPPIDPIMTVVNKSVPDSKKGAYRTFQGIVQSTPYLRELLDRGLIEWDRTDRIFTFKNTGWVIEFVGATDVQSAKQGKRQYLFVNEANGLEWEIFWQYAKRTRIRTWIDYNPSEPFWAHDKLIGTTRDGNDLNADVQLIISDHRHNPFLSDRDHEKTEKIKDPELFKVYARGMTGKLTGLIYKNWKMIPYEEFMAVDKISFGAVDFGYTNDPTCGLWIKADKKKKTAWIHELCYEPGISMTQLANLFKQVGKFKEETPIYCEHDFESTRQLRGKNLLAIPAQKGSGSVNAGILMLNKEWTIYYTDKSENINFELKRYMWDKDPVTNKLLNTPIDAFNHALDAVRYGIYTRYCRAA